MWRNHRWKREALRFCQGRVADFGCADVPLEGAEGFDVSSGTDCSTCPQWSDGHWDSVFSSHCLEHMANWHSTLSEWMRVVKVGGYLVLFLPCKGYYPANGNPDHKTELCPIDLIQHIEANAEWRMIECFWPDHPYGEDHSSFALVAWHAGPGYRSPYPSHDYPFDHLL